MSDGDRLRVENEVLRVRLSRLTEAILRISEDLDLDTVLQEVADSARSLTDARYSAITTIDESGQLGDVFISGMTDEEIDRLMSVSEGMDLLNYLTAIKEPLRISDLTAHTKIVGFPEGYLPVNSFLGLRILDTDKHIGNIYLGDKEGGLEFTQEDEDTLQMFSTQAAIAIANARRYGAEQRANADLEALINISPVGVLVFDVKSGNLVKFNQEARRIFGVASAQREKFQQHLDGVTFRHLDGREIPARELPMERAIRGGETTRAEEITIQLPEGDSVTTLFNTTPIYSDDDEIVSVIATIQDITPLEELERLRAEFLGMVSHELRAPLTSIKGSAATARNSSVPLDPAEASQFFRIIEEQADNMRGLINDLLDYTRIEAGTLSVVLEPTDLGTVIEQARNAFLGGGYRNIIEVDPMPNIPPVGADRQRLVQVIYNLFSNASKYSREWSTINVTASYENLYATVSVKDEGIGVPAEHLPHLFNKFSRIESPTGSWRSEGYGLGLAICKGIVEAHGGRIWAESDGDGHGTRFAFTIPTVDEADSYASAHPADVSSLSIGAPPTLPERILVLDDTPQILRYVRNTLSEAGYTPIITSSPDEFEHLLKVEEPHLVLLNLVLPGTDGFELMKLIPSVSELPVIFISGRGGGEEIARAFEMGAADYVVKPFSPTELVARIRAALRRRAATQHTETYRLRDLVINFVEQQVTMDGRPVQLTPTEYKLLYELSASAGRAVTHEQLQLKIWNEVKSEGPTLLRSFIRSLRQKLGDDGRDPSYVLTEPRVGYRMATR